eukprot:g3412.t1
MYYLYHEWVDPYDCAFAPYKYPKIAEYKICQKFQVYLDDMWKHAPFVAADMETYSLTPDSPKIMSGRIRLYEGFFRTSSQERDKTLLGQVDTWSPSAERLAYGNVTRTAKGGGFLLHSGCPKFGPISTEKNGDPGGTSWRYDLNDMVDSSRAFNKLHVTPLDVGEKFIEAWEMTNRMRNHNVTKSFGNVGNVLYLTRPHPIFQRHKYNVSGFNPMFREVRVGVEHPRGDEFKLSRIKLPPWNAECEKNRRSKLNLCDFNASEVVNIDAAAFLKSEAFDISTMKDDVMCDYKEEMVYKVFAQKLSEYSPEAWYFLKQFQITNTDIEEMMGHIYYNPEYVYPEKDIPLRRRKVVRDWIVNNRHRWEKWIPDSARTRRCLGEVGFTLTVSGKYIPGKECSGHGVCTPDKWIKYAGVCECNRGWTGQVSINGIIPTLDDCSLMDIGDSINLKFAENEGLGEDRYVFTMSIAVGSCALFGVLCLIICVRLRDTPIWDKHGSAHSICISLGYVILCIDFVTWVGEPGVVRCIARPAILSVGATFVFASPVAKLQYVLGVINNERENPAELVNVNSKFIVFEVAKQQVIPIACILVHYFNQANPRYYRVEGRIWLKYMECEYDFWGNTANYLMYFHIVLNALSALVLVARLKAWKRYENRHYLFLKESLNIEVNVILNAVGLVLVVYFFYQYQSPEEHAKLLAVVVIVTSFAAPSLVLIVVPKIIVAFACPTWNQMRARYEKDRTPLQEIVDEAKELTNEYTDKCKERDVLEKLIDEECIRYEKKKMNLVEQVAVLYESLNSNVPSLHRFLKGLDLLQYQEGMEKNELNVPKLIHLRGDLSTCEHPVAMKRGHLRKMQNALFKIDRLLDYHRQFYQKRVKPVKEEMGQAKSDDDKPEGESIEVGGVQDGDWGSDHSSGDFNAESPAGSVFQENNASTPPPSSPPLLDEPENHAGRLSVVKKTLLPV